MSFNELCHTLPDIHISISIQFSLNPLTNNKNIGSALLGVQRRRSQKKNSACAQDKEKIQKNNGNKT